MRARPVSSSRAGQCRVLLLHRCSLQGSKAVGRSPPAQRDPRGNQDVTEAGATQIPAGRFGCCFYSFLLLLQRLQERVSAQRCYADVCSFLHSQLLGSSAYSPLRCGVQKACSNSFRDSERGTVVVPLWGRGMSRHPCTALPLACEAKVPGSVTGLVGEEGTAHFPFLYSSHQRINPRENISNTIITIF